MNKRIIIIDGNSLINRAFFAVPPLSNREGTPTNGVYGFLNMMFKIIDQYEPAYLSVAFDLKGPTFRHEAFDDYKAHRKGMPDELRVQMPILKEMLDAIGIHRTELQGFEADDLIGTIANICSQDHMDVMIVTGDKDALQLVNDHTTVMLTKKGISNMHIYDAAEILKEFNLSPAQITDYKGLSGDASDNIPGIPGVGPKTAIKLLEEYHTVEELLAGVDTVSNARIKNLIIENADKALMSKRLATIEVNAPIDFEIEEFRIGQQKPAKLLELLKFYGLHTLVKRVHAITDEEASSDANSMTGVEATEASKFPDMLDLIAAAEANVNAHKADARAVDTVMEEDVPAFVKVLSGEPRIGFFTLYDKADLRKDTVVGIGFYGAGIGMKYVPVGEHDEVMAQLAPVFESPEIIKCGHEIKRDWLALMRYGIEPKAMAFDSSVALYLLEADRSKYHLPDITMEQGVQLPLKMEDEIIGKGAKLQTFAAIDPQVAAEYAALNAQAAYALYEPLIGKLEASNLLKLYDELEMPLVEVLASIEFEGFSVDMSELDWLDQELTGKLAEITAEIYEFSIDEFNINSPKQLGEVLFDKLGLPVQSKTKTGYSTSHDVLEKLEHQHPIVPLVMEYRTYSKLKSTYIDGLRQVVNPVTGKIHTSLNQTVAATGRLSSTEPNLQNIPVRIPLGRKIRRVFKSSTDHVLVDADYSQIELRILAHLSADENLTRAFIEKIDVHTLTASQVLDIPVDKITPAERSRAKEINFGIIYGMSDFGLADNLGISRKMAKAYIESYFAKYPKIKGFMDGVIEGCRKNGYVTTILNRRRYIHDINAKNFNLRSFAERMAMNTPIQGSAADIIKLAMVKVYRDLKEKGMKSRLILQVHDELIIDTVPEEIEEVKRMLRDDMENAVAGFADFHVPLTVDMNEGANWYETK